MAGIISTVYAIDHRDGEVSYQPIDCPAKQEGIRMVCYRISPGRVARICPFAMRLVMDSSPPDGITTDHVDQLRDFGTGPARRASTVCLLGRGTNRLEAGVPPF